MKDLSDLHELKNTKKNELRLAKEDAIFEEEKINSEIEKLRKEKDYLLMK